MYHTNAFENIIRLKKTCTNKCTELLYHRYITFRIKTLHKKRKNSVFKIYLKSKINTCVYRYTYISYT